MSTLKQKAHFLRSYLKHFLRRKGPDSIHSPFVFKFYYEVLKERSIVNEELESLRKSFLTNDDIIDIQDFKSGNLIPQRVSKAAKGSLTPPWFSLFLQRLALYLDCRHLLETGTNLGINAQYLALTQGIEKVTSIEGNKALIELARKNFLQELESKVNLIYGMLKEQLPKALQSENPDFIFLDADHTYEATLYCLDEIGKMEQTPKCIVIHDIYWSPGMTKLWQEVIENPAYILTIDLFWAGLIFPERPMPKQHFTLGF